jgi:hypothetical protein
MRYERLIMTAGDRAVSVRFHPRFTVIAGVGPLEREGIISELLGALGGPRPGTNLEVVTDRGQHVAVLRPSWGAGDRAIDPMTGAELTGQLVRPDGGLDLLAPLGLKLDAARRLSRFGALDLMVRQTSDGLVLSLAGRPQAELWRTAARLIDARARMEVAAASIGASRQDTAAIAEVDARHGEHERAQDRCETVRHHGIFTGMACAVAAGPAVLMNRWSAFGFIAVATGFLMLSIVFRRRLEVARHAETAALDAAGAISYSGFLHQRVAAMIGTQERQRHEISAAVTEHRMAQAAWTSLAGDVDLDWAMEHQAEIAAAAGSAGDADGIALSASFAERHPPDPREMAELLRLRVDQLQAVGFSEESLPLILDEPFAGLDPAVTRWLLELLVRTSGRPQIVLLTETDAIVAWARAGETAGDLSVMSPTPDRLDAAMRVAS